MPFPCAGNCGAFVFTQNERCSACQLRSRIALRPTVVAPRPVTPTLTPGTLPSGATLTLKCRGTNQRAWIDVVSGNTLRILKDTAVQFKVDSTGGDNNLRQLIRYETAQWGGAQSGTCATCSITFSANSTSTLSPSTVTVAFGGQTVQVNVIVYTLNIVSTPADNFTNRSQTDLGVDERVRLSFTTTPTSVTAADAGGLLWKITRETAARNTTGLLQDASSHTGPPANDGLADYIAPYRTFLTGGRIQSSREVVLQLSVVSGPSIGLGPEQRYRIHKPAAHMTQVPNRLPMHWNKSATGGVAEPSAGFFGQIYFAPKDVSFRTLRWREGTGTMECWGVCMEVAVHAVTVHQDTVHGTINGGNAATGCYVNQVDRVRSGNNAATVTNPGGSSTTKVGQKKWPITWEYTYAALDASHPNGGSNWANDWIDMQIAHHIWTQFENGRSEIFKGHVGCSECLQPISQDLNDSDYWPP